MYFIQLDRYLPHLEAGATLLTPGLRLARQISQAWTARQLSASPMSSVPEPAVATVDNWLEGEWSRRVEAGELPVARLLGRLEERLLWQDIVESDRNAGTDFILLQPASAAERAMTSRQMLLQYADEPQAVLRSPLWDHDLDCASFLRWVRRFDAALSDNLWLTRFDAYRQLLSLAPRPNQHLVLCHGDGLPPLTRRALSHLATVTPLGEAQPEQAQALPARRFVDRRAELASAAQWAAQRHRAGAGTTAIVLVDMERDRPELEYFLREAFDCLGARYHTLPVNFSAGIPLGSTPIYRDALLVQRLGREPLSRSPCLALLRSPYVLPEGFAETGQGLRLSKALTDLAMEEIDVADFRHLVATHAPDSPLQTLLAADPHEVANSVRPLVEWIEVFRGRLALCQWPVRPGLDSMEFQQLDRLEDSFDQLLGLHEVVGEVTAAKALSLWQIVLTDMVFQPKTEQSAVQVLGPMEVLGLHFDTVWICGAQSGAFPRAPQLLPFIPGALQRALGLPTACAEALLTQTCRQLSSWQQTHGELLASCYRFADGIEQLPSPLISLTTDDEPRPDTYARWRQPAELVWFDDTCTPVAGDLVPFGGGTAVLKNQADCPFRAWVLHRLGPREVSEPVFGLSAIERGSIVHEALEPLWRGLKSRTGLRALDEAALQARVAAAVGEGVRRVEQALTARGQNLRKRVGSACLDIEIERLQHQLLEWLGIEAQREQDFEVAEQESAHELAIGPLQLKLRPDRVDRLEDGRELVIDYKTGGVSRSGWLGERPREPQLPIYALIDDAVEGIAFARFKRDGKGKLGFVWVGESLGLNPGGRAKDDLASQVKSIGVEVSDWASLRAIWSQRLITLAEEYAAGDARVDPQPSACTFCELASVCRIGADQQAVLAEQAEFAGDEA